MSGLATILSAQLSAFDGKALTTLTEIRARHGGQADYLSALVELTGRDAENIATGATWLLKDRLESGDLLSPDAIRAYAAIMPELSGWQAQLHACQSLQFMDIEEETAAGLVPWLMRLTRHDRPFVRAWSLDGLVRMALQHDVFGKPAARALEQAAEDDAASVRARARKLELMLAHP